MRKSILFLLGVALLGMTTSGCVALLAGAAGGAGTAVWLSNKLTQDVDKSMEKSLSAVKAAMSSLKLKITKETVKDEVAQIVGEYYDGKTIWIDVHRVTASSSKIDLRVGMAGDEEAARKIMDAILKKL